MSLDKAIAHGKEHRRPYRKSQAFDISCRPHGGCPRCANDRKHNERKKTPELREIVEDFALKINANVINQIAKSTKKSRKSVR